MKMNEKMIQWQSVSLEGFTFEYSPHLECFNDIHHKRMAFISKRFDEIHLIVEFIDGQVMFHPRWNIRIETVCSSTKTYRLDVNYAEND